MQFEMITPEGASLDARRLDDQKAAIQQARLTKEEPTASSDRRNHSPPFAERVAALNSESGDLFMALEPPLCGNGLPTEEALQKAQLQITYLEIISCNTTENGAYVRWYFTARQSMTTRGLERVYLHDDRTDKALFIEARKHQYALAHSLDPALRSQLWPSVPLLRLAPSAFFRILQQPSREITRPAVRMPAILAFQQLERGRDETMTQFLQRAVGLYFIMAYLPLEMWFQMPLAMLANQIMLAHRRHYAFGSFMAQNEVDEKMTIWTSGIHLRPLVSYFIQNASIFTLSG